MRLLGRTARAAMGMALLAAGVGLVTACRAEGAPRSAEQWLEALWSSYLRHHVRPSGEVVDPMRNGHVSSEAQSYALVRAVWMRDRATFTRVLRWTDAHLRRPDGLYAWLWDPATQRVLDANVATDGDIEIAWALAMAAIVFEDPSYARQAAAIVRAIRTETGIPVDGAWFPSAGNWARTERIVNLSYFYPYAFTWFARLDPEGGWERASDAGYRLLAQSLTPGTTTLPVDFNVVTADGTLGPLPEGKTLGRTFSFDSLRIAWRLEFTCQLQRDRRACDLATALGTRLAALHARDGRIVTSYSATGEALTDQWSPCFEAAFLPVMSRVAPDIARRWRAESLGDAALEVLMRATDRYYDANWTWFGLAAADGILLARTPSPDRLPTVAR